MFKHLKYIFLLLFLFSFISQAQTKSVKYYSNHANLHTVNTLVIQIPGVHRNAKAYNDQLDFLSKKKYLVLTPKFSFKSWPKSTFIQGNKSKVFPYESSFTDLDKKIQLVLKHHHNINKIIFVGHSAGAQFLQRYITFSKIPFKLSHNKKYKTKFIIISPGTFMYFSKYRPIKNDNCPKFDNYKYGMEHLNHYAKMHSKNIVSRYLSLNITYMVGSNDTKRGKNLLKNCKADMQGKTRKERSEYFVKYLNTFYHQNNQLIILPNTPHNFKKVFQSSALRHALLNI